MKGGTETILRAWNIKSVKFHSRNGKNAVLTVCLVSVMFCHLGVILDKDTLNSPIYKLGVTTERYPSGEGGGLLIR